MPTNLVRPYLLWGSFATALILSPMLFAQGSRGGAGYGGGVHGNPQSSGLFQGSGSMGHYGSFGGAVVPPTATSGRYAFTFSGSNHYGNRTYNQGFAYRRYPPGYIPYYAAAYPFLYSFPYSDSSGPPPSSGEAYGPPPQDQPPPDLIMELDAIHQELAQLKQRADSPYGMAPEGAAPVVEQMPSKPPEPPLILVFRDGTRTEVRDFAVVGQVFWDLSGHPTRKFPRRNSP